MLSRVANLWPLAEPGTRTDGGAGRHRRTCLFALLEQANRVSYEHEWHTSGVRRAIRACQSLIATTTTDEPLSPRERARQPAKGGGAGGYLFARLSYDASRAAEVMASGWFHSGSCRCIIASFSAAMILMFSDDRSIAMTYASSSARYC